VLTLDGFPLDNLNAEWALTVKGRNTKLPGDLDALLLIHPQRVCQPYGDQAAGKIKPRMNQPTGFLPFYFAK
jgi:hypothetical protein